MKKLLLALLLVSGTAWAAEDIYIQSPYSASYSGTPALFKIIETANADQSKYKFHLEFKPGGQQIIAVKAMDDKPQERLAIIAPKYVEHTMSGKLNKENYVPIHALGDACWAVISNKGHSGDVNSLKGENKLNVGGVGVGNATHLTSLQLGSKLGFDVNYVVFKSNYEGLILMAGDGSINMVVERVNNFKQIKEKNSAIKVVAMSCPSRHPDMPEIATLAEQGIEAPFVFNITVASKNMPADKRTELGNILTNATKKVGESEIQRLSDMKPLVFYGKNVLDYYNDSISVVEKLLKKHKETIAKDSSK
jgi:hypothetical protein